MKPYDGEILSMYGDLIWVNHGDGARAQSYFDRALEASPDDWYNFSHPFELANNHQIFFFFMDLGIVNAAMSMHLLKKKRKGKISRRKNIKSMVLKHTYPSDMPPFSQGRPHLAAASY